MSTPEDRFELLVSEMLEDVAPSRPPASLVPESERAVAATRRWPRWYASLRERPMRHHSTVAVGSPTARTAAIVVATLLLVLAMVAAGIAGSILLAASQPIVVDQSGAGDVTTITEAVAMAADGDEILIRPGTYVEAVVVDKAISIRGDGARDSIVWTAPADPPTRPVGLVLGMPYTLLLDDTTVTLSDLTFSGQASAIHVDGGAPTIERVHLDGVGEPHTHATGYGQFDDAIVITGPSRAVVRDNTLVAAGPIVAYDSSEPLVEGNELVDGPSILAFSAGEGMVVRGNTVRRPMVRGIGVYGPSRITIEDNEISDAGGAAISVGAHGSAGTDPIVRRNSITDAQSGIEVAEGAAPTIDSNTVRGTRTGIKAGSGTDALVATGNQLHDNDIGIAISTSDGRFEGNTVMGGTAGIVATGGGKPTIVDNTVADAERRGLAIGARTEPAVSGNRICSLGDPVVVDRETTDEFHSTNDICEGTASD